MAVSWRELVAYEHKLVVVVPAVLLGVHSGLQLGGTAGGAASRARGQLETVLLQHVERLLDERVLQEEAGRVPVCEAVVRVARLVQRLPEHVAAERHLPADQDARQLAELHVREPVAAERERAAVADRDAALLAVRRPRVRRRHRRLEPRQPEVQRLARQPLVLPEALGQRERAVAQVVQHVAEQHAVAVEEEAAAGVARVLGVAQRQRHQRVGVARERVARARVVHAAHVELEDFGRRVRHG